MRTIFHIIHHYVQDVCYHPSVQYFSNQGMQLLPLPHVKAQTTGVKQHFGRPPDHPSNNSWTIINKSEYEKRSEHSSFHFHFHPLFLLVSIIPFAAIAFYAGVIIRILMVTKLRNSRNGSSTPELT